MHLVTCGKLSLFKTDFSETLPLLLLTYIRIEKQVLRADLTELFWVTKERKLAQRSLAEAIRRIKNVAPDLIIEENKYLSCSIDSDFHVIESLLSEGKLKDALKLYNAAFLDGIEFNKRLSLGEEVLEWMFNKREQLHSLILNAQLSRSEKLAFKGEFREAAGDLWALYAKSQAIAYPSARFFQRLHTVMLAADATGKAKQLKVEAEDVYGVKQLSFSEHAYQARALLQHKFNHKPLNKDFLGREQDLLALKDLLSQELPQVITVWGVAGLGKTSLVRHLASTIRGQVFTEDGVFIAYLENLASETQEGQLIGFLSEALGQPITKENPEIIDLIHLIADKKIVFILDNAEHTLETLTPIIKGLHDACLNLKMVISSRQHLNLNFETLVHLQPLNYPVDQSPLTLEAARNYSALALFEQIALGQAYKVTVEDLQVITQLSQHLEGLPLAISLVASWTSSFTPRQILKKLQDKLSFLDAQTSRTYRHKSIRAAFENSVDLLSIKEKERILLAKSIR